MRSLLRFRLFARPSKPKRERRNPYVVQGHEREIMRDVVIVSAARTAVGAFEGTLSGVPATDLG
ncbi:MAG TPA: hypothetical protein EYP19_02545, partial [Desulfobacterales bacterium]|nr:hypothetical protein [Desulfobacterales bacterium]